MTQKHAPLFFVSDAHLGAGTPVEERHKSENLHAFWDFVRQSGGDLVIVGDLFDFWFEFRHAIPIAHFDHIAALKQLVEAGRKVHYVAGNHDFWAGPFFRSALGMAFYPDECTLRLGTTRVVFAHGDGWLPGDRGYRMMRRVLRNRAAIRLFQWVSPDIGFPLARRVSSLSRGRHSPQPEALGAYEQVARRRLNSDIDILITAHLHQAQHTRYPHGEWLVCGDWIRLFTFGVIENERPSLYSWKASGAHERITPLTSRGAETVMPGAGAAGA